VRRRRLLVLVAFGACGRVGLDATIASSDAPPACFVASEPSRVSAYTFADTSALGRDAVGTNHLVLVVGSPQQSTDVPPGFPGYSLAVDGTSGLCLGSAFTFDSTSDHTACWWSKPAELSDQTNQFADTCGYDTWTTSGGTDYQWRINNCNNGTPSDLDVPNVYTVGAWAHICQTYSRASLTRTVYVNGDIANPHVLVDPAPILMPSGFYWCLGEYYFDGSGGGGFWHGLIYAPIWFDRVLPASDIAAVHDQPCAPA
jgi:hypothetical protein